MMLTMTVTMTVTLLRENGRDKTAPWSVSVERERERLSIVRDAGELVVDVSDKRMATRSL